MEKGRSLVLVRWKKLYDAQVVQACCLAQLQAVQAGAKAIIVDLSQAVGTLSQTEQDWLSTSLFPALSEAKLQAVVNVISSSELTRITAQRWSKSAKPFGFEVLDAATLDDAYRLVERYLN